MKQGYIRGLLAGAATATMAAGFTVALGTGSASALAANHNGNLGSGWNIDRTIADVPASETASPEIDSRIKVSATLSVNKPVLVPTTSALKDVHHECLTYVEGSGKVNGKGSSVEAAADYVRMTGTWIGRSIGYEVQYDIGESCPVGVDLLSSVHVSANQSFTTSPGNVGPVFQASRIATATAVSVAPPPLEGAASTLTATVDQNATGTVEFRNNGALLGTGDAADGVARLVWTPTHLDAGQPYSIAAHYLGDAIHAGSVSPAQTGAVQKTPRAPLALTVSPAAPRPGQDVTLTVTGADAGTTVTIMDADAEICTGTAKDDGTARCAWTPGVGSHALAAHAVIDGQPVSAFATVSVDNSADTGPGAGSLTGFGSLGSIFGSRGQNPTT